MSMTFGLNCLCFPLDHEFYNNLIVVIGPLYSSALFTYRYATIFATTIVDTYSNIGDNQINNSS